MSDTFDRSQLDGKDREQLSEIASALGIKAISRLRKAELVDAIVSATAGSTATHGNGHTESQKPRKIRSTRTPAADDLASLAEEENALAGDDTTDDMALIRPRRRSANGGNGTTTATTSPTSDRAPSSTESASITTNGDT